MTTPGGPRTPGSVRRRSRWKKAWENLIVRTIGHYVVLLGAAAALWRVFPAQVRFLTKDLLGDPLAPGRAAAPSTFGEAIGQPVFGTQWSTEVWSASVAMVVAGLFALPVAWIYILTRQKKGFRQSMVHSLIMLPVVVAGVVVLVKNSLALAFSLAGIVAAVRFRNTLEDSKDAVYIFVATGIGLAAGVDLSVAIALSIIFNIVVVWLWYSDLGRSSASLEGAVARRRLQEVRDHVRRPSGFVQALDEEVLRAMSAEQLDALSERARRRQRQYAPDMSEQPETLRIYTTEPDAAMQATEALLTQYVKRWRLTSAVRQGEGTHVLEYEVQFKKSALPSELIEQLKTRAGSGIVSAEVV